MAGPLHSPELAMKESECWCVCVTCGVSSTVLHAILLHMLVGQSNIHCMLCVLLPPQVSLYHRNVARQQQQMAAWLQKRKQENIARRAAGEEQLPEEDPALFKPIPEPSALDQYLVTNQIASYCDMLASASEKGMTKMYLVQGLQKAAAVQH